MTPKEALEALATYEEMICGMDDLSVSTRIEREAAAAKPPQVAILLTIGLLAALAVRNMDDDEEIDPHVRFARSALELSREQLERLAAASE